MTPTPVIDDSDDPGRDGIASRATSRWSPWRILIAVVMVAVLGSSLLTAWSMRIGPRPGRYTAVYRRPARTGPGIGDHWRSR